ncbi:MAG: hypothetical protein AAF519_13920 [Bacteroidota bacterium]
MKGNSKKSNDYRNSQLMRLTGTFQTFKENPGEAGSLTTAAVQSLRAYAAQASDPEVIAYYQSEEALEDVDVDIVDP